MADQNDRFRDEPFPIESPSASTKIEYVGGSETRAELFKLLAKASGEFTPVTNEAVGQFQNRKFKYADLQALVASTRPALSRHGIMVLQLMTGPDDVGNHRLTTILAGGGGELHSHLDYKRAPDVKAWGSQTTYLRRYAYRALFQLDGSDDADNDDRAEVPRQNAQKEPPQAPKTTAARNNAQLDAKATTKPEPAKQSAPPPAPAKPAAPAPEPAQNGAAPSAAPAEAPKEPEAPPAPAKAPSVPPPLPATIPPKETLVAEMQTYLDPKSPEARRPVWREGDKVVERPHFDAESVQTWCMFVIGKGTKATTDEEKYTVILPALRALPRRQPTLPVPT